MQKYKVTGMSCAACSARVEKAVSRVDGVKSCSVNLLLGTLSVEGDVSDGAVISAVTSAGYGAEVDSGTAKTVKKSNRQFKLMLYRLIPSVALLLFLMYFSMGGMLGLPQPSMLSENPFKLGLFELILTTITAIINYKYFTSGVSSLIRLSPNMDALVALGSSVSYIYSVVILIKTYNTPGYAPIYYFESAAMILTLITVGKTLETYSRGKTTSALEGLADLAPKQARVLRDGVEVTVSADELKVGELFAVKPGDIVPADGVICDGGGTFDESMLSGESIPVDKTAGGRVSAATVCRNGYIVCRAESVGEDTVLSQIIKTVGDASATKAPIARVADRVAGVFVPTVLGIAVITFIIWILSGAGVGDALSRAVAVLVISCPCALGLATPVAITVGAGVGAKHGILYKTSESLEVAGRVKTVVLDKTGTVTEGRPRVTDVIPNGDEKRLLEAAAALENLSGHPLGQAVVGYAVDSEIEIKKASGFNTEVGMGVSAELDGVRIFGGNREFVCEFCEIPEKLSNAAEKCASNGKTPMYFGCKGQLYGIIAVADRVKSDSREAISELRKMGIETVLLTGDNALTAKAVADEVGIQTVISGVLPNEKAEIVGNYSKAGKTAMVGDGINDAPALTVADLGIAIGAGTDIAIDAADTVLMGSSLADAVTAIKLGRKTLANIRENLFWAFLYNVICIPLAAGALSFAGIVLSPMIAAAAMSLSSFCVVTNALRLNLFRVKKQVNNTIIEENKAMENLTKTMKINGMMCGHCEARVKKCLEAVPGVASADVDFTKDCAVVHLEREVDNETLKKAVEAQDYEVVEIS